MPNSKGNGTYGPPIAGPERLQPAETNRFHSAGDVRLLVIDDDPAIGRLVQAAFASHDFHVDIVYDPTVIEERLRHEQYPVIILDYILPGRDPAEVMQAVRELQPEASIIVVTAYPSMDSALQCLRAHTHDYLTKPFQLEHLQRSVIRCLESRGLLRLSEEALREQLGATIRERRKALGLTLADMAKRTNVSLGYLSQIELGKNSASIETLYRIALGLRIRVADLFQTLQSPL
jgi:DNA-binding response OmpR family regulator